MSKPAFVWFHNNSENTAESTAFYEKLLGWKSADGPPGMTLFANGSGPMAGIGEKSGKVSGWVPYAEVDDVDAATKRAVELGARILAEKTRGPAGDFSIVRDPGGATIALWQKA
jgi:predicted enzyme related to lactoylglutathione lyase